MDKRLQQFLTAENITQSQLADTLGVTRASISHILSGRNKPGFDFIESMAAHYPELNLEWLISGKGKIYKKDAPSQMPIPAAPVQNTTGTPELFSESEDDTVSVPDIDRQIKQKTSTKALHNIEEPSNHPAGKQTKPAINHKNISKIIIFYDDMSYEVFDK